MTLNRAALPPLICALRQLAAIGPAQAAPEWVLVVHGGAGRLPDDISPAQTRAIQDALQSALEAGRQVLAAGGSSLDAVQSAVKTMEDSGALNAGRAGVLNHEGFAELDAALMDGAGQRAGAVAAVRHVANPIELARRVMDQTHHVLLVGPGAEQFAREQGITLVPDSYLIIEPRLQELRRVIERDKKGAPQSALPWYPMGTVGAVALDTRGNLAAATSTGGLTNKHAGRVGDTPIVGAGTYAENGACAVSGTGVGEFFIRYTAAVEVCTRIKYRGESVEAAAAGVIQTLKAAGGEGGMIALDANGQVAMPFSSESMLRGLVSSTQPATVMIGAAPAGR